MQLKKFAKITGSLAGASCALLGIEANATEDEPWQFDTALLYYDESSGRVKATEGIIAAKKTFDYGQFLDLKVTIDSLTGASPTGAVPQPAVQTFTRPSGRGSYQVNSGETPLDNTFKDTRLQLNGQWTQPWQEQYNISSGLHVSKEYDYTSLGVNSSIAKDLNNKNTTISAGLSYAYDIIDPEGGRPIPLASVVTTTVPNNSGEYNQAHAMTRQKGNGKKQTLDLLFGLTQVINRQMLMQFNYSFSNSRGYQTDPFKMLSVIDNQGLSQNHRYESRPDKRNKHSVYWQTKYHFTQVILDTSYRYMRDDWSLDSHTLDTRIRYPLSDNLYIEPHIRYYRQTAVEFYYPFLNAIEPQPNYATADYRLGALNTYTLGVKAGLSLPSGKKMSVRLEYYTQKPDTDNIERPGVLGDYRLNPQVNAIIVQLGLSF